MKNLLWLCGGIVIGKGISYVMHLTYLVVILALLWALPLSTIIASVTLAFGTWVYGWPMALLVMLAVIGVCALFLFFLVGIGVIE